MVLAFGMQLMQEAELIEQELHSSQTRWTMESGRWLRTPGSTRKQRCINVTGVASRYLNSDCGSSSILRPIISSLRESAIQSTMVAVRASIVLLRIVLPPAFGARTSVATLLRLHGLGSRATAASVV